MNAVESAVVIRKTNKVFYTEGLNELIKDGTLEAGEEIRDYLLECAWEDFGSLAEEYDIVIDGKHDSPSKEHEALQSALACLENLDKVLHWNKEQGDHIDEAYDVMAQIRSVLGE